MRQKISYALILSPLVVAILFLVVPSLKNFSYEPAYRDDGQLMPSDIRPDKLIFLLQYIGKDYGGAVENKKVVNPFEYQEMNDFTLTALEWYSRLRPEGADESIQQKLQRLKSLVENKADWSDVKALTSPLIRDLSQELHVFSFPLKTPDLKKGQDFYNIACADCHGVSGKGRGPAASWQSPLPSNFNDSARMNEATPHQFYNAITFGVAGTAMPSHQIAFTDQERWDIAFYLMTLRDGFHPQPPGRDFGFSMNDLAVTSNENLLARIRAQNHASGEDPESLQIVDHLRQNPPQVSPDEQLAYTRQKLNESFEAYDNANPSVAMESIMDAYLSGIEPLEPMLAQKRSSLVAAIEADFSKLRSAVRANQPVPVVAEYHQSLNRTLEEVGSELASSTAQKGFAWLQSFTIILREGIEAILLIALMITYLVSIGYQTLKKYVVVGALAGLAVGGLTWLAANSIFKITT
ncbi:MAG TPA: c-type cytochrome, partial [bacterium]